MRFQAKVILLTLFINAAITNALDKPAIAEPIGMIKSPVVGKVELKRTGWKNYRRVSAGAKFRLGDTLLPASNATVTVVCPDLTEEIARSGKPSGLKGVCPNLSDSPGRGNESPAENILGGKNAKIPYIISPRHTLVMNRTPIFRWNAISGAKQYTVQLSSPKGIVWQTKTSKPEVMYPGTPPLQPGLPYSLQVKSNTGASSDSDGTLDIGFRLLRDSEITAIQSNLPKVTKAKLAIPEVALVLAERYSSYTLPPSVEAAYNLAEFDAVTYSLTAEGIEILLPLVIAGTRSPAVYRMLGDLYWHTGLINPAITQYLKVIELATTQEELENRTEAQSKLGEIYAATNDLLQARHWYIQAKNGYTALGDLGGVQFVERQLEANPR
ncbi:MAG: tetratricopeptide repeat protein (plasmid) [Leptolyngbya sp. BL-A-14]